MRCDCADQRFADIGIPHPLGNSWVRLNALFVQERLVPKSDVIELFVYRFTVLQEDSIFLLELIERLD